MVTPSLAEPVHHVQFYESELFLAEQVAEYLRAALVSGGAAAAFARAEHLGAIANRLVAIGIDVEALRAAGKLALVDADTMLAQIMPIDDAPDRALFEQHVTRLIDGLRAGAGEHPVRVYGELVDILWARGNAKAVFALEQLWNDQLARHAFTLLCGYRFGRFDRDVAGFAAVCNHHDSILPNEGIVLDAPGLARLEQRAHALQVEIERRKHVERRMLELLEVTSQLAAARDRESIAALVVERGGHAVGAIEGALWMVAPGRSHLQLLAASSGSGAAEHHRVVAMAGDTPLAHVIRTGDAVFLRSRDEYAQRFPQSYARLVARDALPHQAFAVLPLIVDDKPLGGIVFGYEHERAFEGPDRAFKHILARQCAFALARVALLEEERMLRECAETAAVAEKRARTEIELLYELTTSMNRLDGIDEIYVLALDTVMRGSRSDRAAVLLFDDDNVLRFKASRGLSDTYRQAVEGHSPWKREEQAAAPIAVDDIEADPAWTQYLDVFRAEGIRALAFVPLVHHRELIGKFMLYRNDARAFEASELQFAATVSVHVAHALERKRAERALARAYREEREARVQADEATRAREEILSVVSHDLRNPLGTIMMGATSLITIDVGERSHRVRSISERIHRQAERMARLIEDLVDFAGIQAGKLAIDRRLHKPQDIISATKDIFGPMAAERGLRFETRVSAELPEIPCDSERAVQVLSNLVSNALKVTPRGGEVAIGAEPKENEIVFFVRDTGPGIEEDELPRLFERYWRSKQSGYKGAGLGLSIARGIVDAHGGRIWAESRVGAGSTFYFSLASLRTNERPLTEARSGSNIPDGCPQ